MPFFPEGLYTLRPKDVEGIQLEPLIRLADLSSLAAAALQDDFFFPLDRAIILQNIFLLATPGAGQNVTNMQVSLFQRINAITTVRAILHADPTDLPVANVGALSWQGSILIPTSFGGSWGAWGLRFNSTFNAGGVANSHQASYIGVSIPPGNLPPL